MQQTQHTVISSSSSLRYPFGFCNSFIIREFGQEVIFYSKIFRDFMQAFNSLRQPVNTHRSSVLAYVVRAEMHLRRTCWDALRVRVIFLLAVWNKDWTFNFIKRRDISWSLFRHFLGAQKASSCNELWTTTVFYRVWQWHVSHSLNCTCI